MVQISDKGVRLLQHFESCRLESYQDGGRVWTIGWGHTAGVKKKQQCTQEQADDWLKEDLGVAEDAVNMYVKGALEQCQFDALVSFTFNLGVRSLRSSTLLRMVNGQQYKAASREFLRWDHDNGKVVKGLTLRREAEQELFLTGEFP